MVSYKTFDAAFESLQNICPKPSVESVELQRARGRILAMDVVAKVSVPPFSRAMMDGYAIRSTDAGAGGDFTVVGSVAAGESCDLEVGNGQAVRIMTGAPVPNGADCVARFEWCSEQVGSTFRLMHSITAWESIQQTGEDAQAGKVILKEQSRMTAAAVATCAGFGVSCIEVTKPRTASLIVTGSELVHDASQPLQGAQIYSVNDKYIQFALEEDGCKVASIRWIQDDERAIMEAILSASKTTDFVVVTGGVSAGDYDCVPKALKNLGCQLMTEKVWMRPGSPFVSAQFGNSVIFGLSGNPAACCVQFETLVRPFVRLSMGWPDEPFPQTGKLLRPLSRKPVKHISIYRAKAIIREGEVCVDADLAQSSGVISSFGESNCLIRIDGTVLEAGVVVPLRWM